MTITVRTPRPRNSASSAAESVRGGSLSATKPARCIAPASPRATASTRKPRASSSAAAAEAAGTLSARAWTTLNAPLTRRSVAPVASATEASDMRVEGSKGTNASSFSIDAAGPGGLAAAAARIAASTGSCPPSELASAAMPSTWASSKPGRGCTSVTARALRVSVPVLSAHSTSIVAASSTADSRVGSTSWRASARAPSAAASVKVAGSATGIDASTAVSTSRTASSSGIAWA